MREDNGGKRRGKGREWVEDRREGGVQVLADFNDSFSVQTAITLSFSSFNFFSTNHCLFSFLFLFLSPSFCYSYVLGWCSPGLFLPSLLASSSSSIQRGAKIIKVHYSWSQAGLSTRAHYSPPDTINMSFKVTRLCGSTASFP